MCSHLLCNFPSRKFPSWVLASPFSLVPLASTLAVQVERHRDLCYFCCQEYLQASTLRAVSVASSFASLQVILLSALKADCTLASKS